MKKLRNISVLILLITLTGCDDPIQVKLDEGSKLLVIDAFVNDLRETQRIRITNSDSYFSGKQALPVTDAQVILTDLTANTNYNFEYSSNGNYDFELKLTDTISRPNHSYRLSVTVNEVQYSSITEQKRGARIENIEAVRNDGTNGAPGAKGDFYYCFLVAKDKADLNTDYYWIKTFRNDTLFSHPSDLNIAIDGTGGSVSGFLPDLDSLYFTPTATFLGSKQYSISDKCKVEIHSITKPCRDFLQQAQAQINNGGLFATTPENVRTNFVSQSDAPTKVVGWFNMSTVASKTKMIE
jgi:hypothetical protein